MFHSKILIKHVLTVLNNKVLLLNAATSGPIPMPILQICVACIKHLSEAPRSTKWRHTDYLQVRDLPHMVHTHGFAVYIDLTSNTISCNWHHAILCKINVHVCLYITRKRSFDVLFILLLQVLSSVCLANPTLRTIISLLLYYYLYNFII